MNKRTVSLHLNVQVNGLYPHHRTFSTTEFLASIFKAPFHPSLVSLQTTLSELSCFIPLFQRTSFWHWFCGSCLFSASLIASFIFMITSLHPTSFGTSKQWTWKEPSQWSRAASRPCRVSEPKKWRARRVTWRDSSMEACSGLFVIVTLL